MTCTDFDRQLDAWLAGTLPEQEARGLEQHAADCSRCELRLDAVSQCAPLPSSLIPPVEMREAVLLAVRSARVRRRRSHWLAIASGIAAVAVVALLVQPPRKHASDVPGGAAILYAAERARPQFAAIESAEAELIAALRDAPGDAVLLHALQELRQQRVALQRLVREAAS